MTSRGSGRLFLSEAEARRYAWFRETVLQYRATSYVPRRVFERFAVVAGVLVTYHPERDRSVKFDVHYFGLRAGDLERARTGDGERPFEAVTFDEIRQRITRPINNLGLEQAVRWHTRRPLDALP
ncbi:MAG TPA: hypothetical protein PLG75_07815 [Methanoculleus sp.]|nr:hypothetical protein [Methanoculleus sp.]